MNKVQSVLFMVGISLALAFTFGCSSGGGGSGEQSYDYCVTASNTCLVGPYTVSACNGQVSNNCPDGSTPIVGRSSSSGGGTFSRSSSGGKGVPFNENSQIYYEKDGTLFTGSGDLILYSGLSSDLIIGSVTNGIVHLELPTIPNEDLRDLRDFFSDNLDCTDYPNGIKYYEAEKIALYPNGSSTTGNPIGWLFIEDEQSSNYIWYWYFSKAGKITCTHGWGIKYNIDAKAGWNRVYDNYYTGERSTNNILTKEVKWMLDEL